jgi:hypothetical protein
MDPDVHLHWNTTTLKEVAAVYEAVIGPWTYGLIENPCKPRRIPNTAIVADLERQTSATIPVTHYFDLERSCVDCNRPFIFFAEEQKYWYEELGFGLDSDCIRCVDCRKKQQHIARERKVYEALFYSQRDIEANLIMAEACLTLIEAGAFKPRKSQTVRMLLNAIPADAEVRKQPRFTELQKKLRLVETSASS